MLKAILEGPIDMDLKHEASYANLGRLRLRGLGVLDPSLPEN